MYLKQYDKVELWDAKKILVTFHLWYSRFILFLLLDALKGNNCEEEVGCPFKDCAKKFNGGTCNVS